MFYLNRTGAPEGPFEEGRILAMIGSGELVYGNICWVGHNQWAPLEAHPPFARALAERRASAHVQGPAPAGPGRAYAAPAPAHAAPMAAGVAGQGLSPAPSGAYVSPSGSYASPSGSYASPPGAAPRARSESRGQGRRVFLILALFGIAGVFLVGTALGAYMLFFGSSAPKLSASVPRDAELYFEIPSLKKSLADLGDVQFLETSSRDDAKLIEDAVSALVRSFEISEGEAKALLLAAESAAFAGRKLVANPEAVLVLGFQRSGPVDDLLRSRRFSAAGALGSGGKRYLLARKVVAQKGATDLVFESLSDLEVTAGRDVLVWFAERKVLMFGDEPMVSDAAKVIEGGAPALTENPSFAAAVKDFPVDGRLVGFVDPSVLSSVSDRSPRELIDAYFKPAGPLTLSVLVKKAGFLTSFAGRFIGSRLPKASLHEPAIQLSLPRRLPAETFAYAAFSTKSRLSASDVEKILLDHLGAADPAGRAELERGLRDLERLLGVTTQKVYEALGQQAALALLGPADFTLEQVQGPDALARFAVVYVQELKDENAFKALSRELSSQLPASGVNVTGDASGGFVATPWPLPASVRVKFVDRHLFVSAGADSLNDRAEAAFLRAERTLEQDAAHRSARSALPELAHLSIWVDTGRIADTVLKSPLTRMIVDASGIQTSHFKLAGDQRVTSALSLRTDVENETWIHRIDAVNLQAVAPLAAGAVILGSGRALQPAAPGPSPIVP